MDITGLRKKIADAWAKVDIQFVGLKSRDLAITMATTEFINEKKVADEEFNKSILKGLADELVDGGLSLDEIGFVFAAITKRLNIER